MDYDLIVIGAGSAGLACARRAASHGASVAIVERDKVGGTCVNRGCVPKKLLWHLAHWQCEAERLDAARLISSPPSINVGRLFSQVRKRTQELANSLTETIDEAGIDLLRGEAEFHSSGTLTVDGAAVTGRQIAIATGAKPISPDITGAEHLRTSSDIFALERIPDRICLIGGGYIGTELCYILTVMGCDVTIVERGARLIEGFAENASALVQNRFEDIDVALHFEREVEKVVRQERDQFTVHLNKGETIKANLVVDVTGRAPERSLLNGQIAIGEQSGTNNAIPAFVRTNRPGVFAIGDVSGVAQLTPVARFQGLQLADHLFGELDEPESLGTLSTAVFAEPPVAEIKALRGQASGQMRESLQYAPLLDGILPNVPDREFGVLLEHDGHDIERITAIGDNAPELIQALAPAVNSQVPLDQWFRQSRIHPTAGEEIFALIDDIIG